jgi:acetyl-CoA carboxylase carboxyltransferase component/biotin carboxyl carrier protein
VNLEEMAADGTTQPASGTITSYEVPSGPGVRVDGFGYGGYTTSLRYDSLLAKVVAHSPVGLPEALRRVDRALAEVRIDGVATNIGFLSAVVRHPDVAAGRVTTTFVADHLDELVAAAGIERLHHEEAAPTAAPGAAPASQVAPPGTVGVDAPVQGTVVSVAVAAGDVVPVGQQLLVLEAMKMEHVITAAVGGTVSLVAVGPGDTVQSGQPVVFLTPGGAVAADAVEEEAVDLDHIRRDLAESIERHELGLDAARPDAVARRRKTGHRTARENIADLCDEGSFLEYAPLAIAAQRRRRSLDDLIRNTPADGLVGGVAKVNGALVGDDRARTIAVSYDYTVLAGTQGQQNHRKKDRLFELAERERLPLVLFAEGGGGRPGDTDALGVAGLDCMAFNLFGRLSGLVPLVGVVAGRCFAGNAALLGCCDVIIATRDANIGMGGPAMIEGGGLGVFRPDEVGPTSVQVPDGVIDVLVEDEAEAVAVAKQYLSYFQGPVEGWACEDQRVLRHVIPENRLRIYDVRAVIESLCDTGSVLELRPGFGLGMVTALARVEGKPVGIVANNPSHLAGAIDGPAADKAARFLQLCDAFDIPILFLCDTPGFMVGPEAEATGLVRHCARLFVNGANLTVPFATIVLRKGYGLGAQAMAGGSFKSPLFLVSWPTGEFGGMGLEGAVRLGYRKELEAVEDPAARDQLYREMVDRMYEHGKALNMASHFEIDDVIDPVESRRWISSALLTTTGAPRRTEKKRPNVDTW